MRRKVNRDERQPPPPVMIETRIVSLCVNALIEQTIDAVSADANNRNGFARHRSDHGERVINRCERQTPSSFVPGLNLSTAAQTTVLRSSRRPRSARFSAPRG